MSSWGLHSQPDQDEGSIFVRGTNAIMTGHKVVGHLTKTGQGNQKTAFVGCDSNNRTTKITTKHRRDLRGRVPVFMGPLVRQTLTKRG